MSLSEFSGIERARAIGRGREAGRSRGAGVVARGRVAAQTLAARGALLRGRWFSRIVAGWDALLGRPTDETASGQGEGRRAPRRAFRPLIEGQRLEPRVVLSHAPNVINQFLLTHPSPYNAYKFNRPPQYLGTDAFVPHGPVYDHGQIATETARGGHSVIVAMPDGSRFRISLDYAENLYDGGLAGQTGGTGNTVIPSIQVQPQGSLRVYAMPGNKIGIITNGNTSQDELVISPLPQTQRVGYAHSFNYAESGRSHILNIGSIQINGGNIQAILGFHDAVLSGPLTIGSTQTVDRLAFDALLPGAAIGVGGTLNTMDIATGIDLNSGPGISIGRDLNLLNVGGSVNLSGGANFIIGRDMAATLQPPKGTGTGSGVLAVNLPVNASILTSASTFTELFSVAAFIQGDLNIAPGSLFSIGRAIQNNAEFRLLGRLNGASRLYSAGIPLTSLIPVSPLVPVNPAFLPFQTGIVGGFAPANVAP